VPNLEVFNYALTGSGTDQQYLTYLDCADVECDLLIIGLYVENIRRVNHRFLQFLDESGQDVFYAKPYYGIENGELVLHQVPVPKRPWTSETLPPEDADHVDRGASILPGVQDALRRVVPRSALAAVKKFAPRDLLQKVTKFQPIPEYDSPDDPSWVLLRKILETWIRGSRTPVLLVTIPMWMFVDGQCDPASYLARFRELASDTGCLLHDPLPDLWQYTADERRAFRFKHDTHLSTKGHEALARSLAPVIERLRQQSAHGREPGSPVARLAVS
jgi:carbamoyltransferase